MTGTGTQTRTTGVTTIALLVLRTGELKTCSGSHKPPDEYFGRYETGFFFSRFHLTEFNIKVNLNQS